MEGGGVALNWESPELLNFLFIDQCFGFGFQCDKVQSQRPFRIYVAQLFEKKPDQRFESFDETAFLAKIRPIYTDQQVWITDYLGHDFLTVSTGMFKRIPEVINACLNVGYNVLTHTCVKTMFRPGMMFNQRNFELELIRSVEENYNIIWGIPGISVDTWGYLKKFLKLTPLKKDYNWTTPEGKAFCVQLRRNLRSKHGDKTHCWNHFEKYWNLCCAYGIFQDHQEDDCIVCMENPASTIVFPCECKVVCEACSEKLKTTPDQKTCSRCRREINMVIYTKSNKIEEK